MGSTVSYNHNACIEYGTFFTCTCSLTHDKDAHNCPKGPQYVTGLYVPSSETELLLFHLIHYQYVELQ